MPPALAVSYGGDLGFAAPTLFANFVSSVDGVVTLPASGESGRIISGGNEADRFVMALLRARADVVLVGAGTFRKAGGDVWRAADVYPVAAPLFAEWRRQLGLSPHPPLALVSASGEIDVTQAALDDAWVFTTPVGEARLRGRVPAGCRLVVVAAAAGDAARPSSPLPLASVVQHLRAAGMAAILTEGGPTLMGRLVAEGLVDELFVTSAPSLFGRSANDGRKSLVDGLDTAGMPLALLSARRHGSFLLLRYALSARPS